MAKDTPTKEPTLTAPPAETPPPGGGGLTADVYAEDRAATEKAMKADQDAATAHIHTEALAEAEAREDVVEEPADQTVSERD
jgi:hypothetical protein